MNFANVRTGACEAGAWRGACLQAAEGLVGPPAARLAGRVGAAVAALQGLHNGGARHAAGAHLHLLQAHCHQVHLC